MAVADAVPSSATGVVHMNEKKDSTGKVKSAEEELIEALPEEARKELTARGVLIFVIDDDGSSKYLIPSGFNRLSTKNCQW
jgi:hypothetical protein